MRLRRFATDTMDEGVCKAERSEPSLPECLARLAFQMLLIGFERYT